MTSAREQGVLDDAMEHARLMGLGKLETSLLLSFIQRVFWSGKVEGLEAVEGLLQRHEEEKDPTKHRKN
jgi:hypothetical protein